MSSKSFTTVTDTTTTETLQPQLDQIDAPVVAGNQGTVTLSTTDAGATKAALDANQAVSEAALQANTDTAYNAIANADHSLEAALGYGIDVVRAAVGATSQSVLGTVAANNATSAESQRAWVDTLKWVGLAIAGAIVLPPLLRKFR